MNTKHTPRNEFNANRSLAERARDERAKLLALGAQRIVGACVLCGLLLLAKVAGAAMVAIELGADVQELTAPSLETLVHVVRESGAVCHTVSNARPMGSGWRIACDRREYVYLVAIVNGSVFVTDISESGQ